MVLREGITVCVLLYGNFPELAARCLLPMANNIPPASGIRIGLNVVSDATLDVVRALAGSRPAKSVIVYNSPVNRLKYPMMRKMFYDPAFPITTRAIMWFDDDSAALYETESWVWPIYDRLFASPDNGVIGHVWQMRLTESQKNAIARQPWYRGLPVPPKATFATGGWWLASTEKLFAHRYPFTQLLHGGGDSLLGEMMRQNGYKVLNHVAPGMLLINADKDGRPSKADRRGTVTKTLWAGNSAEDHTYAHRFELKGEIWE